MEETRDLGTMRRSELIGGLIYWVLMVTGLAYWPPRLLARALYQTTETGKGFLALNLLIYLMHVLVLSVLLRRFWREQASRFRKRGVRILTDLGLTFALYYGATLVLNLLLGMLLPLLPDYNNENQAAVNALFEMSTGWSLLLACILAPLAEEAVYRGLLFRTLHPRSRILAYAVSMLLFAGAHVWSHALNQSLAVTAVNLLIYLVPGFCLAWIYERSGSIFASVLLHSIINGFVLLLQ